MPMGHLKGWEQWRRMETTRKNLPLSRSTCVPHRARSVLPPRKSSVLVALLHYLREDSLTSTATREQIKERTGLSKGTIYTIIREFAGCGLLTQWRGPFNVKQKFYRLTLPVTDEVFEFYGHAEASGVIPRATRKKKAPSHPRFEIHKASSVLQDTEEEILQAAVSAVDSPGSSIVVQDSSDIVAEAPLPSSPPDAPVMMLEAKTDLTASAQPLLQDPFQEPDSDVPGSDYKGGGACAIDPPEHDDDAPGPYFSDPRLDLLIDQIELGRKHGTRVFRWFQSQNILTYWPPTDSYRVERHMLREKVKSLDELNAILTAPVRPEYQWFVTAFLEVCRDNGTRRRTRHKPWRLRSTCHWAEC